MTTPDPTLTHLDMRRRRCCLRWTWQRRAHVNTASPSLLRPHLLRAICYIVCDLLQPYSTAPLSIQKLLPGRPLTPRPLQDITTANTPHTARPNNDMADVEMTDAGAAPKVKSAKAGASGDVADGKKKFEVKKVRYLGPEARLGKNHS